MIDEKLKQLAAQVDGGDLAAAGLMLDRLSELDDARRPQLLWALGMLTVEAAEVKDPPEETRRRRRQTQEELAYRRDEMAFRCWRNFSSGFRRHFWAELSGRAVLQHLEEVGAAIDAGKQAGRLRQREEGGGDEDADEMTSGPVGMAAAERW